MRKPSASTKPSLKFLPGISMFIAPVSVPSVPALPREASVAAHCCRLGPLFQAHTRLRASPSSGPEPGRTPRRLEELKLTSLFPRDIRQSYVAPVNSRFARKAQAREHQNSCWANQQQTPPTPGGGALGLSPPVLFLPLFSSRPHK